MEQVAPYRCDGCGAVQIGPYDEPRDLTQAEIFTGWYAPTTAEIASKSEVRGMSEKKNECDAVLCLKSQVYRESLKHSGEYVFSMCLMYLKRFGPFCTEKRVIETAEAAYRAGWNDGWIYGDAIIDFDDEEIEDRKMRAYFQEAGLEK